MFTTFNTPERHWPECVMSQVGVVSLALRSRDVYTVVEKPVHCQFYIYWRGVNVCRTNQVTALSCHVVFVVQATVFVI